MKDYLDYGKFIDEAMRYVVRRSLRLAAQHGLPGEHHFFITFETQFPGVMISDELMKKYPEEMTIVLQHQFWNLEVEEERFSIVLSFDNVKQNLTIPFEALISFADPSVKFGLQFHSEPFEDEPSHANQSKNNGRKSNSKAADEPKITDGSNVITLDSFRKK